jgi:hypothetical protein
MSSPESPRKVTTVSLEYRVPPRASVCLLVSTRGEEIGCQGARRREEAHGVLGVTRGLVVATLAVAGVALALVGGGKRGRTEKASLGHPLALGRGCELGRLRPGQDNRGRKKGTGRLRCWVGPREMRDRESSSFSFSKNLLLDESCKIDN